MQGEEAVLRYHEATKHSPWTVRRGVHRLDWSNEPRLFKVYPDLPPLPLPRHLPDTGVFAVEAVNGSGGDRRPDLAGLAGLLLYSAGILRRVRRPWGEVAFRAAPCTGALYHVEIYLVCTDLAGLDAGVYHFDPQEFALRRLRSGDFRGVVGDAAAEEAREPAVLVLTSMWPRNAWKYRARAYRHAFWDTGTILANLLALASAHGIPARVVVGFADTELERLLELDPAHELPVAVVPLGAPEVPAPPAPPVPALGHRVAPVLRRKIHEPLVVEAHEATRLHRAEDVRRWRAARVQVARDPVGPLVDLRRAERLPAARVEDAIRRRRSTRQFSAAAVPFPVFSEILAACYAPVPADFPTPLTVPHLLVHAVEDLPPGVYVYHTGRQALELLRPGEFRQEAGFCALEQPAAAAAAVDVAFLAPLPRVVGSLGPRGYRAAQLEGGIRGGRVYLLAHAFGMRATALTFYDDELVRLLGQDPEEWGVMFLAVFGRRP